MNVFAVIMGNGMKCENAFRQIHSLTYHGFTGAAMSLLQHIKAEAVLQTVETGSDLAWIIKVMAQRIIQSGAASAEALGIDTLEERLSLEREKANDVFIRDMVFGVCAVK